MSVRPDLKGKTVYFFPTLDKYFEGILIYEVKEKKAYVYSAKGKRKFDIPIPQSYPFARCPP